MKLITDTGIVMTRELRPALRDPFTVVFSMVQPLVFLALFGPLLRGIPGLEGTGEALQWFVPGIIVMVSLFGVGATGSNLLYEMQTGSHERLLVTPLSRSSLLIGRALKEIIPTVAQALLIVVAVSFFGFRLEPAGIVIGLILLAVFSVGLGALSYSLALACRNQDWMFWAVQQTLLFPLLLLAGMLLPLDLGPGWLQAASKADPLTYIVNAERALFDGVLWDGDVLKGAIAAGAVAAIGLLVGTRSMHRATV